MLKGTIDTMIDVSGSTQVRYYQVDLTLISRGRQPQGLDWTEEDQETG